MATKQVRRKHDRQTLEQWLGFALSEESDLTFRDVHFDMLDDFVRETGPGLALLKASCDLLERTQQAAKNFDLGPEPWQIFVSNAFYWDKKKFPLWRPKYYWKNFGTSMEPPSLVLLKGEFSTNRAVERYVRRTELPFLGYPEIDPIYEVARTLQDIGEKEYYPRIYLHHMMCLGGNSKVKNNF